MKVLLRLLAGALCLVTTSTGWSADVPNDGHTRLSVAQAKGPLASTELLSGVPATFSLPQSRGLAFANGDLGFRISVPDDATSLTIEIATTTPNADIDVWARHGQDVDVKGGLTVADHVADGLSGNETLVITSGSTPPLRAGTYYIGFGVYTPLVTTGTIKATIGKSPNPPAAPPVIHAWQTDWNVFGSALASFLRIFQYSGTGSFLTSKFAGKQVTWTATVRSNPGPNPGEIALAVPTVQLQLFDGATGPLSTVYVKPKPGDQSAWSPQALPNGRQITFRATLGSAADNANDIVFLVIRNQVIAYANAYDAELTSQPPVVTPPPPAAAPSITGVGDSASSRAVLVPGSWFTIRGSLLDNVTRSWEGSDFRGARLPTGLSGTSVTVAGRPAYVAFVSPAQINALVPAGLSEGPAVVEVTAPGGTVRSNSQVAPYAPALFPFAPENGRYAAAVHPDGTLLAKPGLFGAGVVARPIVSGGRGVLYGTGFGRTDPATPDGETFADPRMLAGIEHLRLTVGARAAAVEYAGAISPGLFQINFVCPELFRGDHAVQVEFGGGKTQADLYITVDGAAAPAPAARLGVSPGSLSFSGAQAGAPPAPQTVEVSFTPSVTPAPQWSVSVSTESGGSWLSAGVNSGSGNGRIAVSANTAGLAAGEYRGRIVVAAAGAANSPQAVPVTLTIRPPLSSAPIVASREVVTFDMTIGGAAPAAQQIQATAGGGPVDLQIEVSKPEATWLRVTSSSPATPATLTFEINPRSITQGRYARLVRLIGPAGQTKTVLVVFTVLFPGDGVFNTATSLRTETTTFGANPVGQELAPQNLGVTHPGGRVPFTVQVNQYTPGVSWLRVAPVSGQTPGNLLVNQNTQGLGPGFHDGLIRVFNDRSQSEIPVQIIVRTAPPL